jgi:hypothetical protein
MTQLTVTATQTCRVPGHGLVCNGETVTLDNTPDVQELITASALVEQVKPTKTTKEKS